MSGDDHWTTVATLARSGNLKELRRALSSLDASHLMAALQLSNSVGSTAAAFALLQWICAQTRPLDTSPSLTHWLYAHNNALHMALRLDELPPAISELVERSVALAPLNPSIYQNAAGVYCRLGQRDQALAVVREAVSAQVDGLASYSEDPDLASLHEDPEFRTLMAPALRAEETKLHDILVPWRERFGGDPPQEWTNVVRQVMRGQALPSGISEFLVTSHRSLDLPGVAPTWVCRGHGARREETWRAGYLPALGKGAVVFVDEPTGVSWAAPSLWAGLLVLAESAHNPVRSAETVAREAKNYQATLPTLAQAKRGALESSAMLAGLLSHAEEEPAASEELRQLRELAAQAEASDSTEVYVLRPSARPWFESVARIGGPAAVNSWPMRDDGAPMAHLLTLDLQACPLLRRIDPSLSEVRALGVFVGPDRGRLEGSASVPSDLAEGDEGTAESPVGAVLRPRRELCFEAVVVPATIVGPPDTSWTLAQTRLADALATHSCLRPTPEGAELLLRPQDVGLRPSSTVGGTRMYRLTMDGLEEVRVGPPSRGLLDVCGAPLVVRSEDWSDFARGPFSALEQLLVRMCFLAKEHFELRFALDGVTVRWTVGEQRCVATLDTSTVSRALDTLFSELNTFLEQLGLGFRFAAAQRRLWLVSGAWDAYLVGAGLLEDLAYGDGGSTAGGPLPSLPNVSDLIPPERVFARDTSYASLLSQHIEAMATHFGIEEFSIAPRFMRPNDEGQMRLTATHTMMSWSPSVPGASVCDLAPLIDEINRYTDTEESGRRIYEYRVGMFEKGALLASQEEARALRQAGWLLEDWRQEWARETLGEQGIEFSRFWSVREVVKLGRQLASLMPKEAAFSLTQERHECALVLQGKTSVVTLNDDEQRPSRPLVSFAKAVNGLLAEASSDLNDKRWVLFEGEHDRRLVFVTKAWAKALAELSTTVERSLEDGFSSDDPSPLPIAYPRPHPTLETASVPSVRRLVPKSRVLSSDFKCSARTTDYPELVASVAGHAKLDVSVEPYARESRDPWGFFVYASFDGVQTEIAMGSDKYADLAPVLGYLNGLLERIGSERRLCFYRQPPWDEGVLFIDRDEAELLASFQIACWPGEEEEQG